MVSAGEVHADMKHRLPTIGWLLFLVSAILFAWSGVRSGDWVVVWASVAFGFACLLFLLAGD